MVERAVEVLVGEHFINSRDFNGLLLKALLNGLSDLDAT